MTIVVKFLLQNTAEIKGEPLVIATGNVDRKGILAFIDVILISFSRVLLLRVWHWNCQGHCREYNLLYSQTIINECKEI
jgi:hypothetical protein